MTALWARSRTDSVRLSATETRLCALRRAGATSQAVAAGRPCGAQFRRKGSPRRAPGFILGGVGNEKAGVHRDAARRHEMASASHARASKFWEGQGDGERAELQREMADYEQLGAQLELRWAELTDPSAVRGDSSGSEQVRRDTQHGAKTASWILSELAMTLDRSAALADEHAERRQAAGFYDAAADERRVAKRAREAAERARSQADQWRELHGQLDL